MMPDGHDADAFRREVLARFDMSLGTGLGKLAGRVFRIGHLGYFNDLMLCGTLCGVEMGLALREVPHRKGGVARGARLSAGERHPRRRRNAGRVTPTNAERHARRAMTPQQSERESA